MNDCTIISSVISATIGGGNQNIRDLAYFKVETNYDNLAV